MDELLFSYHRRLENISLRFKRNKISSIDWRDRFIAITGARGVGKTTMMLQYLKENLNKDTSVYFSLDNLYFTKNTLLDTVALMDSRGISTFFIDEVHKYPNWSIELKNIYDDFPKTKVVFTGSSILEIYKGQADLSRRVVSYHLHPMSFREFLEMEDVYCSPSYDVNDILKNHTEIASNIVSKIKPLKYLEAYLLHGAYPYYIEGVDSYHEKLMNTVNLIIDYDLPTVLSIDYAHAVKLKKLLSVISDSVPFKPNISKLASAIEVERRTVYSYLDILERAGLINLLCTGRKGDRVLNKPDKIYLNNSNIIYALSGVSPNIGNIRETFFYNQLMNNNTVNYTDKGDFLINDKYIFEVGGLNKKFSQIADIPNSFLAKDDIEIGFGNTIPLWLFGFLY